MRAYSSKSLNMRDMGSCENSKTPNSSKLEPDGVVSVLKLVGFKKAALRRGNWFRVLSRIERGVIDLTVKYVDCIRSEKLAKVLTAIIVKLQLALESVTDRLVRTVGLSLARKISNIAVSWGSSYASKWAEDLAFAKYLALNLNYNFGKS